MRNEMSSESDGLLGLKGRITADKFHKELLRTMMNSTSAIHWGRGGVIHNNGSMFFLDTGNKLLAVTARHVYRGYVEAALKAPLDCYIDSLRFDPIQRLVSEGRETDIATFRITREELAALGKITIPWPPVKPHKGKSVMFSGVPGFARSNPRRGEFGFGCYVASFKVDNVDDTSLSLMRPPQGEMVDIIGKGFPPDALDIGGMSGGPIASMELTPNGIFAWSIAALIYEGHQSFDIIKGVRADLIDDDGIVHDCP
jgi:hypothetical protein